MPLKPAHPTLETLPPYVPGKATVKGHENPIKLSSNENPFGLSPKAREALLDSSIQHHRYPEGSSKILRDAIGEVYDLDPNRIIIGVGSDELINLIVQAYAGPGDEVLYSYHGFLMYPLAALRVGATPVAAKEEGLKANVDNLLAAVTKRTRLVFLANPNNPTGSYLNKAEVARLHKGLREDIILVLDSAYAEYVMEEDYSDGIAEVSTHTNVVMTRTFSKIYGMGGLRLGWGYFPAEIAELLNRMRPPFNIATLIQKAGAAAVRDTAFVQQSRTHNAEMLSWFSKELMEIGLLAYRSAANFVLVEFTSDVKAQSANQFLLENGIIVRQMDAYHLPSCLRITIGTKAELELVLKVLKQWQEEAIIGF